MTTTLYGISNCDTVKRARAWLNERGIEHRFHDYKKAGVPQAALDAWLGALGWERLLNRQGTSWRKLDPAAQQRIVDAASAKALMCSQPSVIRRPVVEWDGGALTVGFDPQQWSGCLANSSRSG